MVGSAVDRGLKRAGMVEPTGLVGGGGNNLTYNASWTAAAAAQAANSEEELLNEKLKLAMSVTLVVGLIQVRDLIELLYRPIPCRENASLETVMSFWLLPGTYQESRVR